jgi:ATP-dependent DNA helicase RecQ
MGKYDRFCQKFGFTKLKPLQHNIVDAILGEQCDVVGIMSTGYGKSACYQIPFEAQQGTQCVLVISPLIALMQDQVTSLIEKGIDAVALNSNLNVKQRQAEIAEIAMGTNKIIYMSPEFCMTQFDFLNELYYEGRLLMIAIDEAHCISSWGNDFRSDYRHLSCLKKWFPEIPIMALTATATAKVREDIAKNLGLTEHYEYVSSFDRPNIYIDCRLKSKNPATDFKPLVKEHKESQAIIYVRTRDLTEKISNLLHELGVNAKAYHAGLPKAEKTETFDEFVSGECKWIVATIALGMGIDQNIPLVIHYGAPGDIESYYQEIGRAGRNGEESSCIMFYGAADMRVNKIFLKDIEDPIHKRHRESQIKDMENFLRSTQCRRKLLLQYFGEEYEWDSCDYCNNCCADEEDEQEVIDKQNALQYPVFLLRVFLVTTSINSGMGKIYDILLGRGGKKTKDYCKSPFYGIGTRYKIDMWKIAYETCMLNEYITNKVVGFGSVVETTNKLLIWAKNNKTHIKKLKSYSFDDYLTISFHLQEKFQIPHGVEIMRHHNTRSITMAEQLMLDQGPDYVVPEQTKHVAHPSKWSMRSKK